MRIFESLSEFNHEQLVFCYDEASGLRSIICVHSSTLGPALGGCRMWPYRSEEDAIIDVLRLARGMTYKASAAGLNLGGGKAVIIGDPKKDKTEALFRTFGRFVDRLKGRYITAEDVGTTVQDMEYVFMETRHVTGVAKVHGGGGDPSPITAYGVFHGMRAAAKWKLGEEDLSGLRVAVQGLGNVGRHLTDYLLEAGAKVIVTDIDPAAYEPFKEKDNVDFVEPQKIYAVDCDIFAPCALGAVVNDDTLPQLTCSIVAGAANNVLLEDRHGRELEERGILYAPDYVINAGGLINVYVEMDGYVRDRALRMAEGIHDNLLRIFTMSSEEGIPTFEAAARVAEQRINAIQNVKRF